MGVGWRPVLNLAGGMRSSSWSARRASLSRLSRSMEGRYAEAGLALNGFWLLLIGSGDWLCSMWS